MLNNQGTVSSHEYDYRTKVIKQSNENSTKAIITISHTLDRMEVTAIRKRNQWIKSLILI